MESIFHELSPSAPRDQLGPRLRDLLTPGRDVDYTATPLAAPYAQEGAEWVEQIQAFGPRLQRLKPYTVTDLGCNNGAKAPIVAGFGATQYHGYDVLPGAVRAATLRWGSPLLQFHVADVVHDAWEHADVILVSYIVQHLPLTWKTRLLRRVSASRPRLVILLDEMAQRQSAAECDAAYRSDLAANDRLVNIPVCGIRTLRGAISAAARATIMEVGSAAPVRASRDMTDDIDRSAQEWVRPEYVLGRALCA